MVSVFRAFTVWCPRQVGVAMGQRGTEVAKVHRQWKFRETPETQIFLTWDNVYLQYLAMLQYTY
jgi:magnesium-transporting ATPase (P-type)